MRDSLNRRKRFAPRIRAISDEHTNGLRLTERDYAILELLHRYRYLRSDRLVHLINPKSRKRFIERLGKLYHEARLMDRPKAQLRSAKALYSPITYELSEAGRAVLIKAGSKLQEPVVSFAKQFDRTILQFEHAVETSDTLAEIEGIFRERSDRAILFEPEILAKASVKLGRKIERIAFPVTIPPSKHVPGMRKPFRTSIVPDAFFAVEHRTGNARKYRFYALEVEHRNPLRRSTLEQPSFLKKLLAYQALIQSAGYKTELGIPNLFLVISASDDEKATAISEMAEAIWWEDERKMLVLRSRVKQHRNWREHFVLNTSQRFFCH
ncbi:MAG: replication-relaxation family protein [Armatimonadetes bacterium]|nr:replication-relaxation family protein [Armatimonadota bacterium]